MSGGGTRRVDVGLLQIIRDLQSRVSKLEAQQQSYRRNDIRLGDAVMRTDTDRNRISIQNLGTGETVFFGDPDDIKFSWSGVLAVAGDETDYSPPAIVPSNSTAVEAVLAIAVASTEDISVELWLNDNSFLTTLVLPADDTTHSIGLNIPVSKNSQIRVRLTDIGAVEGLRDLSVTVRFGSSGSVQLTVDEAP
jgi:hypothetical protein